MEQASTAPAAETCTPPRAEVAREGEHRAGYRVHCALPLRISGTDSFAQEFSEPAHTEIITRDGGLIVCSVSLAAGTHITMQNGEQQARARVVGTVRIVDDAIAYGVHFLDGAAPSFWNIEVNSTPPDSAAGRTVLECSRCRNSQVVELGEIDMVVMEHVPVIGHFCSVCGCETLWEPPNTPSDAQPVRDGEPARGAADDLLVTGSAAFSIAPRGQRERTREKRKYRRLVLKNVTACIKAAGNPDEVVNVIDFSRGGLRFRSTVDYQLDARLEVAVPYTKAGANIYVPAKVVRVILPARGGLPGDFACAYYSRA